MTQPRQGEVWWAEVEDKRRPVLIITRSDAIPVLSRLIVAPLTRTVRGIPTEIRLGPEEGLATECAAAFDNAQPINRHLLTERLTALGRCDGWRSVPLSPLSPIAETELRRAPLCGAEVGEPPGLRLRLQLAVSATAGCWSSRLASRIPVVIAPSAVAIAWSRLAKRPPLNATSAGTPWVRCP